MWHSRPCYNYYILLIFTHATIILHVKMHACRYPCQLLQVHDIIHSLLPGHCGASLRENCECEGAVGE